MASVERTVKLIFGAVDETGTAFKSVGRGLETIERRLGGLTDPLAQTTDLLIKTEAAIGAVAVAFLGFAYNEAVKFESALFDLAKQLNGGIEEAEGYRAAIIELSETYGESSTAITQAFADFKQAGFETSEALQLVELALKQVRVSELSAAESSEFLVRILKGFNAEVSDVSRILDLVNETTNNYAINTGQLSEALARTSSVAAGAGFSIEETIGILTPMIEVTQSAELSSRAFNATLQRMTSVSKEVAKGFDILGIEQRDINGEIKSGNQILREAQGAFGDLSDSNKVLALQYIAGKDHASKFRQVLEQGNRTLEITKVAIDGVGSSLEKELTVRMKSAQTQIDQTKESFNNLAIAIGERFKVEATGAVDATGDLFQAFRRLVESGGLSPLFDQLRPLLVEFDANIRAMAEALPEAFEGLNFRAVEEGFRDLGEAITDLFGGIDLTTPEGLRSAIQTLIDVGGGLLQVTTGIVEALAPFIQQVAELGREFGNLNPGAQQAAGNLLGIGKALNVIAPAIGGVGTGLNSVGVGLSAVGSASILKTITGLSGALGSVALALAGKAGLVVAAGAAGYGMGTFISQMVDRLIPGADTLGTALHSLSNPVDRVGASLTTAGAAAHVAATGINTLAAEVTDVVDPLDRTANATQDLIQGEEALAGLMDEVNAKLREQGSELQFTNEGFVKTTKSIDTATGDINEYVKVQGTLVKVTRDAETGLITYSQAIGEAGKKAKDTAKDTKKLTEETDNFRIKMEEIASNERIRVIEAKISLDIAGLQEQTKQVEAAFTSIDNTITNTGDLLGSLFGDLADAGRWEQLLIEDQIEQENKRRTEALKKQNELIDAQIKYLKEKANQLRRGDAMIKVDGDGLQPHLEAMMWEVLQEIQVRANADGMEFLLGVA